MNWNNVSIRQYKDLVSIKADDDLDYVIEAYKILFNKDLSNVPMIDFSKYVSELTNFLKAPFKEPSINKCDKYEGNTLVNLEDVTYKQFSDIEKIRTNDKLSSFEKDVYLLCVLFVKDGFTYDQYDALSDERIELFWNFGIVKMHSVFNFFFQSWILQKQYIQKYINSLAEEIQNQ